MTILWHSVKYPPKKDGMYYYSHVYSYVADEENWELSYYKCIGTYEYTVKHGWNTGKHSTEPSKVFPIDAENDQWAEVEYVED